MVTREKSPAPDEHSLAAEASAAHADALIPPTRIGRQRSFSTRLRRTLRYPQFWFGLIVLLPTILYYCVFAFFPILRGLWLAVVDYDFITRQSSHFVGLDNFYSLSLNPLLLIAARNTVLLGALEFCVSLPLALAIATCLVNVRRGMQFYQSAIFLPVVVSLVAVSLLFRFLLDPDVGAFNSILRSLHLPTSRWLSSPSSALATLAAIDIWKGLGFGVVLLTAGMLNIPTELYDAARVDGVNEWQRFRYMTLPLLSHTLALVMVLGVIGSLQVYTSPTVLTQGGPGTSTLVYNMLIVQEGFTNFRFGVAAAAAVLQFAVIFVISVIQLKLLRPKWSY
jgi:ABC-type sugar transport system permease subunit